MNPKVLLVSSVCVWEGTSYTVELSELLAKLSSEHASGRTEGNVQLRSEEVTQLGKVLGEEVSRVTELLDKDTGGLLRLLNEKMKRNAKVDPEETRPSDSSATAEDASDEKAYGTSSRKPQVKKVKAPRAQERTKTVRGPRARRNRRKRSS
jgi:hypothetical protein